jgi:hypothetical protein
MASKKTKVVKYLYEKLSDEGRTVANFADVSDAIAECNERYGLDLSDNNPANFMKDLLRGMNASKNWPVELTKARITGRQLTGDGRIFEFISFDVDQTEAFPNPFEAEGSEDEFVIESLSLPLATKTLGREDEAWLIQVSVWMRLLENHFARMSCQNLIEVSHLQNNIKLGRSEIDALFLAVEEHSDGSHHNVLITCEAKQQKDPILGDQIVRQISAAFRSIEHLDLSIAKAVPVAVKALKGRASVYVVEFDAWSRSEALADEAEQKELQVASKAVYRLEPPIPGIGFTPRKKNKSVKPKL